MPVQHFVKSSLVLLLCVPIFANQGEEVKPVYHTFAIEVGRGVEPVKHLRYLYSTLGWRETPIAAPPGSLSSLSLEMSVPEEFEVSWESSSGKAYHFKVPVRSLIPGSVKRKSIHFVIMGDHVEEYLGVRPRDVGPEDLVRIYPPVKK